MAISSPSKPSIDASSRLQNRKSVHEAAGEWPQPSLAALMDARVRATPDAPFVIEAETGRVHSFRSVDRLSRRIAGALEEIGIRAGDVVSWQLPNIVEAPALAIALDRLAAVSNPIITMYRERELRFICRQVGARALLVPGIVRGVDHRELAEAARDGAPDVEHVLTVRAKPGERMRALEGLRRFQESDAGQEGPSSARDRDPHAVSMVFYTSGTTSDPKGVLHTPSTVGALVRGHAAVFGTAADERALMQFPLGHVGGITLFIAKPLATGSSVVFVDRFDPAFALDCIERYAVTSTGGPPAALIAMLEARNFAPEKVRSLVLSGAGAADVSPDLMRRVESQFGVVAFRSYGMTECPMLTTGSPRDTSRVRHETDGRPLPGCRVRSVGEDGRPIAVGCEGELEIFGPQLCIGYRDPALDEVFTTDGFLRTGDLGVVDTAGSLRITGRRKDVILRKGETLSAREIEDLVAEHPQIVEVAVIGLPDAERGERVCACVTLRDPSGELDSAALADFMRARGVMPQKMPEQVQIVTTLPRNATGKVRKDVLRERFREPSERR